MSHLSYLMTGTKCFPTARSLTISRYPSYYWYTNIFQKKGQNFKPLQVSLLGSSAQCGSWPDMFFLTIQEEGRQGIPLLSMLAKIETSLSPSQVLACFHSGSFCFTYFCFLHSLELGTRKKGNFAKSITIYFGESNNHRYLKRFCRIL